MSSMSNSLTQNWDSELFLFPENSEWSSVLLVFWEQLKIFMNPLCFWFFWGLTWCFVPPRKSWFYNNYFCWCGSLSSFNGKCWHYLEILNLQIFSSAHLQILWEPAIFSLHWIIIFHDMLWLLKLLPPFIKWGGTVQCRKYTYGKPGLQERTEQEDTKAIAPSGIL